LKTGTGVKVFKSIVIVSFAVIFLIILLAAVIGGGSTLDTSSNPTSVADKKTERIDDIKGIKDGITDVTEYPQTNGLPLLMVAHFEKTVWSEASWVNNASYVALSALKKISRQYPNEYSGVMLVFYMPTTDQYGNADKIRGMNLVYSMDDAKKINWDNATNLMILNLASTDFNPIGKTAQAEFCKEDDNMKYADIFCRS